LARRGSVNLVGGLGVSRPTGLGMVLIKYGLIFKRGIKVLGTVSCWNSLASFCDVNYYSSFTNCGFSTSREIAIVELFPVISLQRLDIHLWIFILFQLTLSGNRKFRSVSFRTNYRFYLHQKLRIFVHFYLCAWKTLLFWITLLGTFRLCSLV
jgi:hypothetical protein